MFLGQEVHNVDHHTLVERNAHEVETFSKSFEVLVGLANDQGGLNEDGAEEVHMLHPLDNPIVVVGSCLACLVVRKIDFECQEAGYEHA